MPLCCRLCNNETPVPACRAPCERRRERVHDDALDDDDRHHDEQQPVTALLHPSSRPITNARIPSQRLEQRFSLCIPSLATSPGAGSAQDDRFRVLLLLPLGGEGGKSCEGEPELCPGGACVHSVQNVQRSVSKGAPSSSYVLFQPACSRSDLSDFSTPRRYLLPACLLPLTLRHRDWLSAGLRQMAADGHRSPVQ